MHNTDKAGACTQRDVKGHSQLQWQNKRPVYVGACKTTIEYLIQVRE